MAKMANTANPEILAADRVLDRLGDHSEAEIVAAASLLFDNTGDHLSRERARLVLRAPKPTPSISQMLDSRDIERRAENTSFRIRRVARWTASLAINLIAGFVIAIFLGHLIEKSARNLAIDVGRAHDARW